MTRSPGDRVASLVGRGSVAYGTSQVDRRQQDSRFAFGVLWPTRRGSNCSLVQPVKIMHIIIHSYMLEMG